MPSTAGMRSVTRSVHSPFGSSPRCFADPNRYEPCSGTKGSKKKMPDIGVVRNGQPGNRSRRRHQLDLQVPERVVLEAKRDLDELGEPDARVDGNRPARPSSRSPASGASGTSTLSQSEADDDAISGGRFVQLCARSTAAPASTSPKPYSWLKWYRSASEVDRYFRAPSCQPELAGSFLCAEAARISFRSRHVRSGFALRISAATPATIGAAADVPPKSWK